MPKSAKKDREPAKKAGKKAATGTPSPETSAKPDGREVVYARVSTSECSTAVERGPLMPVEAKTLMGWETEPEYQKRMVAEKGGKPEQYLFGDNYHCLNSREEKVRCWRNANNRPLDMNWCKDLRHTILVGQWAGPHTIPGETVNGETIRISRYGNVISAQHQLTALILADEELLASRGEDGNILHPKYPFWNGHEHPFIESLIVTGVSEDERVLRTIDYVKPRTTADMLFTMSFYRDRTPSERKEMTRMLAAAIDLLWTRTLTKGYRTHPEIVGFLERHKKLLKCVEHLFKENSTKGADGGRRISNLRISAGHASALCYLMASSGPDTDGDVYRNEDPPSEKNLDWSHWDKALEFWSRLAGDRTWTWLRKALKDLVESTPMNEENQGMGGRFPEKVAIITKAWAIWKEWPDDEPEPPYTREDLDPGGALKLSYGTVDDKGNPLPEGEVKLLDDDNLFGIDYPTSLSKKTSKGAPEPPPPTHEELARAREEADRRHGRLTPEELRAQNEAAEAERKRQMAEQENERKREEQKRKLTENRATKNK